MKILIAEDERITRRTLRRHLESWGHEVVDAANGSQGWDEFQTGQFPIVISDWEMPEMDGVEFVRRIRAADKSGYVYIILLTAKSGKQDIVEGMEAGADDFISKPFDRNELHVRLRAGERIIELERNLADRNELLRDANTRMKRDLEAAAAVQQSLLPTSLPQFAGARFAWSFRPCDELAGDFLNVFQLDRKHIGFYVVDVSGHGVAASLLSVTISRLLTPEPSLSSLLVQPGTDSDIRIVPPSEVMGELNKRFPMEESAGRYFTMVYGILNTHTRQLRYVCAGHPPILRVSASAGVEILEGNGTAIGWFPESDYEETMVDLRPGDRLYLYSDGIPEAMNPESAQFGSERLIESICQAQSCTLENSVSGLTRRIEEWCDVAGPTDDVSILAVEAI